MAYVMGYALAGFTTFVIILGRYGYGSPNNTMCSCCSVLEQKSEKGIVLKVSTNLRNFTVGLGGLFFVYKKQLNLRSIIRMSLLILITVENKCILTAEIVDLIFYKYSIFLSGPLASLTGAFTAVSSEVYRKMKSSSQQKRQ
jgi:hypothetical protein